MKVSTDICTDDMTVYRCVSVFLFYLKHFSQPTLYTFPSGLLSSPEDDVALQASLILRELIDQHIDGKGLLTMESKAKEDDTNVEFKAVQIVCTTLYNLLSASSPPVLNLHLFSVTSSMFLKLGRYPSFNIKLFSLTRVTIFISALFYLFT